MNQKVKRSVKCSIAFILIGLSFYFPIAAYLNAKKFESVQTNNYTLIKWHLGGWHYAMYESSGGDKEIISKVKNPMFPFLSSMKKEVTVYPPTNDKYFTLRVWDSRHGAAYILVGCKPPHCWYESLNVKDGVIYVENEMRELLIEGRQKAASN